MPRVRPVPLAAVGLLIALIVVSARAAISRFAPPAAATVESPGLFDPALHCARVRGDAWSPLSGVEYTGRLGIRLPPTPSGQIVLVIGDEIPLDVAVETAVGVHVPVTKELLEIGRGSHAPPPDYWLEDGTPWDAPREAQRLTIRAGLEERVFSVRLGRRAPRVLARLEGYGKGVAAAVCAAPPGPKPAFEGGATSLTIQPTAADYFGTGWSGIEEEPTGAVRRMEEHAALLIPSMARGNVRVEVSVLPGGAVADAPDAMLSLRVNGIRDLEAHVLRQDASVYRWNIPAGAWLEGTNELLFTISGVPAPKYMTEREARPFEIGVSRVTVTLY